MTRSSDERNEHRRAGVEESERLGPTGRLLLYTSEKQRYTRVRGRDESDQLWRLLDLAHLWIEPRHTWRRMKDQKVVRGICAQLHGGWHGGKLKTDECRQTRQRLATTAALDLDIKFYQILAYLLTS